MSLIFSIFVYNSRLLNSINNMNMTEKNQHLKNSLKNATAKLMRRDEKIAQLEAKIAQQSEELRKCQCPTCGFKFPEYATTIPGHQFSEFVVRYALSLRSKTNCSSRDIVKVIQILAELTIGLVDEVPSYNTVDNWVRKCGLDEIKNVPQAFKDKEYAAVVDECMMIGSEKLLPVIAVPAEHQGRPLRLCDAKVVEFFVKSGWTAQTVSDSLKETADKMGKSPLYLISDNDGKMRKAAEMSSYVWHRDISHTLAMFMEREYKADSEFLDFNNKMATCKKQNCMKEIAYLQSPSQRVKARFMNLSDCITWADKMLEIYHTLNEQEKNVFSFLPQYSSFIDEMQQMVSCIHEIELKMKHYGLSKGTVSVCKRHVCRTVMCGNERMRRVGQQILDYLKEEDQRLKEGEAVNNSSDIIESTFGIFKYNQSPNKMNGVTTLILHLPVKFAFAEESAANNYNVKERLCKNKVRDITLWRNENLMESQVVKRIKTLKSA